MNGLIIDCFAGGGGASVGIEMALGRPVDIAINHDPQAIRMHKVNHPQTLHLTEDIFRVDLEKYVAGRHVALMWASPDCTSHSKAKGGQPRKHGLRILPWAVYKHAKKILPDVIIMENVEEIQQWGPLDKDGHPIKERAGEDYRRFIQSMKSLGYAFDSRELVAADYGAPTTRKRWYAVFRRDRKPIVWPEPTHFKDRNPKWIECGDYIDWTDLGRSIFDRKKPLAEATMKRIANGYRKYVVDNPDPYIVKNKEAVAFLIQYHGEQKAGESRGQHLQEPIKTIDTSNRYGLVAAFVTKFYKTGIGQGCDEPMHTITTSPGHFGVVSVCLERREENGSNRCNKRANNARNHSVKAGWEILENSKQDATKENNSYRPEKNGGETKIGLSGSSCMERRETISDSCTQSNVGNLRWENTGRNGYQSQERKQTGQQTGKSGGCDKEPELKSCNKNGTEKIQQLSETVFCSSESAERKRNVVQRNSEYPKNIPDNVIQGSEILIHSWLTKYYGTGCGQTLSEPLATITTKDRFGLVNVVTEIDGQRYILKDIFLRMLKPEELKLMQGFPRDYIIDRDSEWKPYPIKEQVTRIGNSVVPIMAEALVKANCPHLRVGERRPAMMIYRQKNGQMAFG